MHTHKGIRKSTVLVSIIVALLLLATMGSMPKLSTQDTRSYIVQGTNVERVSQLVAQYGGTVTSKLGIIQGVGATLSPAVITQLLSEPAITQVTPNEAVQAVDDGDDDGGHKKRHAPPANPETNYPDVVGADVAWAQGVNGEGVTVAVVDTGLGKHLGLFLDTEGHKGRIIGWADFVKHKRRPEDKNGHGTHIAGIIANTQVGEDAEWNGTAPGVNLVGVRVLNKKGEGTYEQVIQGIQWVVDHKEEYNIRVMNLSLVALVQSPYWADPLNQAVMQAWAEGITIIVAAGNQGPDAMTVGVPGNNPYVITVGAFTDNFTPDNWEDDYITPFSAAGPTLDGFVKPDVVAPGAHMVSTMRSNTYLARQHGASKVTNQYFSMSGTSQAAAVVSGIAALTLSNHPDLTPDEVKYRIAVTAFPWVDPDTTEALYSMWQQGAGRVNAPDAVYATDIQGTANTGMDIWADLAGTEHYEGYSYFDEATGAFRLKGDFNSWAGGYGTWAGGYGTWAGGYGTWAGGYGTWAGGYGTWAGGYGTWAGGYGTWAGGYGTWAGNYGEATFAEGFANWSDVDLAPAWAETQNLLGTWVSDR